MSDPHIYMNMPVYLLLVSQLQHVIPAGVGGGFFIALLFRIRV